MSSSMIRKKIAKNENYACYLDKNGNETTYEKLVEEYQNANLNCPTIIDWRSDVTNMFKQTLYTVKD